MCAGRCGSALFLQHPSATHCTSSNLQTDFSLFYPYFRAFYKISVRWIRVVYSFLHIYIYIYIDSIPSYIHYIHIHIRSMFSGHPCCLAIHFAVSGRQARGRPGRQPIRLGLSPVRGAHGAALTGAKAARERAAQSAFIEPKYLFNPFTFNPKFPYCPIQIPYSSYILQGSSSSHKLLLPQGIPLTKK